jgi:prepilin-type N-terminal cleavage/methylation domain-containing protein
MNFLNDKHQDSCSKGFTLVELLIVIAIIAVLASVVTIALNPGELLAQGRDAKRINDLNTLRVALESYISLVPSLNLGTCPTGGICTFNPGAGDGPFVSSTCGSISVVNNIIGTGWIDVVFTDIPGPSPVSVLPIDPINSTDYFYAYGCSESPKYVFELNARFESEKHRGEMALDYGNKNCLCGGVPCTKDNVTSMTSVESLANNCFFETGNAPGLSL